MSEHKWDADFDNKSDREQVLRERETPWPKTLAELNSLIHEMASGTHTYGSVVEAMGLVASAAMNYMDSELGTSGFQSSCADLVTIRRRRCLKGPYMLMKLEDVMYPQYDLHDKLDEFIRDSAEWISSEAKKNLEGRGAHPDVIARWEKFAKCEGNGEYILKVLAGKDPFVDNELEFGDETTDFEADNG